MKSLLKKQKFGATTQSPEGSEDTPFNLILGDKSKKFKYLYHNEVVLIFPVITIWDAQAEFQS